MKSYSNLYYKMLEPEALKKAVKGAAKGKRTRKRVAYYLEDIDETIKQAFYWVYDYNATYHRPIDIYDGISRKKKNYHSTFFSRISCAAFCYKCSYAYF